MTREKTGKSGQKYLIIEEEKSSQCAYCTLTKELRPYGRNGVSICFQCAMLPENKATTEAIFSKRLNP